MKPIAAIIASSLLAFVGTSATIADTITVCPSGCDHTTIQGAINAASDGDVIMIHPGTYKPTSTLVISGKSITLQGTYSGADLVTIIDGESSRRILRIDGAASSNTVIRDLVFANGHTALPHIHGGAIRIESIDLKGGSSPTIQDCDFKGNHAHHAGGGIWCNASNPDINDCTFTDNSVGYLGNGGAIGCVGSSPYITDCTITCNRADHGEGGGISCVEYSDAIITSCTVTANNAWQAGSGINSYLSNPTITDSTVCVNTLNHHTTTEQISGPYHDGGGNSCVTVPGDHPTIADAISAAVNGDVINIAAGTYNENDLNPGGKAITIQGTLSCDGSLGTTIHANQFGAVFNLNSGENSNTSIKHLVITGGSQTYGGGIFCSHNSNPTITGCTISGNTPSNAGGGIYCQTSSPTINRCTIISNSTYYGGGVYAGNSSEPELTHCTISHNDALYHGGGIYVETASRARVHKSLVTHNQPDNIYVMPTGSLTGDPSMVTLEDSTVCGTGHHVQGLVTHVGANDIHDCIDDGDLNGDGVVDADDLAALHGSTGIDQHDVDHNGVTNIDDLLAVIANWSPSSP